MYKAVHFDGKNVLNNMSEYLRRHDIVYKTPALKPYEGLPVGNGFAGGLLYHTKNSLEMTVNHTDAIDFAPDGPMQAWAWEAEEKSTAPVSCGSIQLISDMPCFDWVYLTEYEERLNLAKGCIDGKAVTPFSQAQWHVYASEKPNVLVIEFSLLQEEEAALTVRLEKWSTPNFFHHYEQVLHIHDKNLNTVKAGVQDGRALLEQDLGRCRVAMAAAVAGDDAPQPQALHSRGCAFHFPKQKQHHFTLYVSVEAAEGAKDPAQAALANLRAAQADTALGENHALGWQRFWERSFVHLQDEEYIENLYYVNLYQLNSCGRGKYPITFAGLWGWFGDSRNWGHFYHWNHQQTYWGVYAANHPELAENYLEYRFQMLPNAIEDAKTLFGAQGAFFSDVSNLNGFNAAEPDTIRNFSVGAQISLDFYRYYCYTHDGVFLRERALPVMTACAEFYESVLVEENGRYVIRGGSTAYESYWNLKETLTDHVAVQALMKALLDVAEDGGIPQERQEQYHTILNMIYPPRTELIEHNGKTLEIFSVGQKWSGEAAAYGEGEYPLSPFPASLMSPVYPSGLVGLTQKDSEVFQVARNTARVLLDNEVYRLGKLGCSGHAPAPELAARLGMARDAMKALHTFVQAYQIFPNGLMHFADVSQNQQWSKVDTPRILEPGVACTQWEEMHEKHIGNRTSINADWFLHCYFEAAANLTAGVNELLLQSFGGVLRVFPALEPERTAMFTLAGEGGFLVTSEKTGSEIRYVHIRSGKGVACVLADPWQGAPLSVTSGGAEVPFVRKDSCIVFETAAGQEYLLYPTEYPLENYYKNYFACHVNQAVKKLGTARLGLPEIY